MVFGFATSITMLLISRLVQGAGGGTTGVAQAYVADTIAPERRAQALGWLSAATSAGVALGPTIGSLAFRMGHQAPGWIAAALCAVNALCAWIWLPESRVLVPGAPVKPREPLWAAASEVIRHPAQLSSRLVFIYAAGMLAFTALTSVLTLFLHATIAGVDETTIGYFYTYIGLLSVVIRALLLGPVVRRLGEVRAMQVGTLILIVGLLLYPFAHTVQSLLFVVPLVPIGTALLFPSSTSLLSRSVDRSELGVTMGVAQTFAGLSRVVAPIAAAAAFQRIGHGAPFVLAAVVVAGVSVLAFRIQLPIPAPPPVAPVIAPSGVVTAAEDAGGTAPPDLTRST
jgi:MFS family permease